MFHACQLCKKAVKEVGRLYPYHITFHSPTLRICYVCRKEVRLNGQSVRRELESYPTAPEGA
jgi:hypothetical protein